MAEAVASLIATAGTSLGASFQIKMTCTFEIYYLDEDGKEHKLEDKHRSIGPKETDTYFLNQPDAFRDLGQDARTKIDEYKAAVEARRAHHESLSSTRLP